MNKKIILIIIIAFIITGCQNIIKPEYIEPVEYESCQVSTDCRLPMEFAVQSNCPYSTACINKKCNVICPMWQHSPNMNLNISYQAKCQSDTDCDCSGWDTQNKYECLCLDNQCASRVAEIY
jgi:hypothetical protein